MIKIKSLDFDELRAANVPRCESVFSKVNDWDIQAWALAVAGEAGEVAGAAKKLLRGDTHIWEKGERKPLTDLTLGLELADIVIYADLLAARMGMDLGELVRQKFNETSRRYGSEITL